MPLASIQVWFTEMKVMLFATGMSPEPWQALWSNG